eukprot:7528204-Heterocapsa_arctica.AAC.1
MASAILAQAALAWRGPGRAPRPALRGDARAAENVATAREGRDTREMDDLPRACGYSEEPAARVQSSDFYDC